MVSVTEMHVYYHYKQQCTWCMDVDLVGFRDNPFLKVYLGVGEPRGYTDSVTECILIIVITVNTTVMWFRCWDLNVF